MWRTGEIPQDSGWTVLVLVPKGSTDRVHPKMNPLISYYGMYRKDLFIVGIGQIQDKYLMFIFISVSFVCVFDRRQV